MNKISIRIGSAAVLFIAALFMFFVLFYQPTKAHANPESFLRSDAIGAATGSATTSPNYMTAGNSTTTIAFDSAKGNTFALSSAVLQLGIKSSTTVTTSFGTTTLSFRIEQSDNGIDWSLATSSTVQTGICEQVGSSCTASTSLAFRTIEIIRPLRFVRAIVGVQPGTSNNGAAWGQWIGRKENQ